MVATQARRCSTFGSGVKKGGTIIDPLVVSEAELTLLQADRILEGQARDVLSSNLTLQLKKLFPSAPTSFLSANSDFSNELARGAGEIADAVSAASINWTGPARDAGVERVFTKDLVRLMAVDALVSGKLALFPRIDERGVFVLEALTGYLHPLLNPGNALLVDALLQVLPVIDNGEQKYQVRVYRLGMLEVYPAVADLKDFAKGVPTEYPQRHAPDSLPVAFRIVRRDAHRRPQGLVAECLAPFRRYAKTAINRNAVQEIAGWPERVVKSDEYLTMVRQGDPARPGGEHPAVTVLKDIGPRKLKLLGTNDSYDVQDGADPAPHILAEELDKRSLLDLLRSPDLSGGNLTGVALAERQSKSRQLITDLCDNIAGVVTDACAIADGLPAANIGEGIAASLTPRWALDRAARVSEIKELYSVGVLPKSGALLELQSAGFTSVTDAMIEAAQLAEQDDALITEPGNGLLVTT